jgi:16S rRNA A1518/A1519 N6-dimethyltransferase RsmA/KsgA/DIM1 with predicted DNA glycosylase/AP lyase activity
VIGVEKDKRFEPILQLLQESVGAERLSIAYADMLEVDEAQLLSALPIVPWQDPAGIRQLHHELLFFHFNSLISDALPCHHRSVHTTEDVLQVVGNLPFNVATELLLKWLRQIPDRSGVFRHGRVPFTLMFQSEVADVGECWVRVNRLTGVVVAANRRVARNEGIWSTIGDDAAKL